MDELADEPNSLPRRVNEYKYKTFAQRISAINIDVIHKIRYKSAELEGTETFFAESLSLWREKNCTKHFQEFCSEAAQYGATFNQLIHHELDIVRLLISSLTSSDSLAIEPYLDLVVQLARDLQMEFYKHYQQFFDALLKLLSVHAGDPDILEKIFICFAYLFKFLWRYLIKDLLVVYEYHSPLLGSSYKEHINSFAAESFAFLLRKTKDFPSLCDHIFQSLQDHPDRAKGVGHLFYQMMKGINQQFHTITFTVLPKLFEKMSRSTNSYPERCWNCIEVALQTTLKLMADGTSSENLQPFWKILLEHIDKTIDEGDEQTVDYLMLKSLLLFAGVWIKHKNGLSNDFCNTVAMSHVKALRVAEVNEVIASALIHNSVLLLTSRKFSLELSTLAVFIPQIYRSKLPDEVIFEFFGHLYKTPILSHILPAFLERCSTSIENNPLPTIIAICRFVLSKFQGQMTTEELFKNDIMLPPMNASSIPNGSTIASKLHDWLIDDKIEKDDEHLFWAALICIPHIRPLRNEAAVMSCLLKKIRQRLKRLSLATDSNVFMLSTVMRTTVLIGPEEVLGAVKPAHLNSLLMKRSTNIYALSLVDLVLTLARRTNSEKFVSALNFVDITSKLQQNLCSHDGKIRALTIQILSNLCYQDSGFVEILEVCSRAEALPLTVQNHRERVRLLQKLDCVHVLSVAPSFPLKLTLLFIIGEFYKNFTDIWPVASSLVVSYAENMSSEEFWGIFQPLLISTSQEIDESNNQKSLPVNDEGSTLASLHVKIFLDIAKQIDNPDKYNFEYQVWNTLIKLPSICQLKSKDILSLFSKFLSDEYYASDKLLAPSQDLRRNDSSRADVNDDCDLDEDEDEEEDDDDGIERENYLDNNLSSDFRGKIVKKGQNKDQGRPLFKTLIAHLNVVSEVDALEGKPYCHIFQQLLCHYHEGIQQAALKCLCKFDPNLYHYRNHLENLVSNKTFKDKLFELCDASVIDDEHRTSVLPVIMRVLYGKMSMRGAKNRASRNTRRSQIFRFLVSCTSSDLKIFVDLTFEPCRSFVSDTPLETLKNIRRDVNIGCIIPLVKVQGILDMTTVFLSKMAHQLDEYLPIIFQCILGFGALCEGCLRNKDTIWHNVFLKLKRLRSVVIELILKFFKDFPDYVFSDEEIKSIFEISIWPSVPNLPSSKQTPTSLLKLLHFYSESSRYYILLAMKSDELDTSLMNAIVNLLSVENLNQQVLSTVLSIITNLLSLSDQISADSGEDNYLITQLKVEVSSSSDKDVPPGIKLILPRIDAILSYIERVVKRVQLQPSKLQTYKTELGLLSRLSEFVFKSDHCDSLLSSLLPFISKSIKFPEHTDDVILNCVFHLMKKSKNTSQFLFTVSHILSWNQRRKSRMIICDMLNVMGEENEEIKEIAIISIELNSWNARHVEEPDYERRLKAFEKLNNLIENLETLSTSFIIPIVYNVFYLINFSDDFSLRDASSRCLQIILKKLSTLSVGRQTFDLIINKTLLPELKSGLRNKKKEVRDEFVSVFTTLVKFFSSELALTQLIPLADEDPDVDFFTNIRHIQIYKRSRALRRLQKFALNNSIRPGLVTNYLLPLVSVYLSPEFRKDSGLQEIVVDAIGSLSSHLQWSSYCQLLIHYLKLLPQKLDQQKLYIKVVVSILDSFVFDLSNSQHQLKLCDQKIVDLQSSSKDVDIDFVTENDVGQHLEEDEVKEPTLKKQCSESLSTRIHRTILDHILPQLYKNLTRKAKSDDEHKLAKKHFAEDTEILAIPISLAMIKLLQKLPRQSIEFQLPKILLKVCQFLRSRSFDIRDSARSTLVKISRALGPEYFPYILHEMKSSLQRGYQLHILSFTINVMLHDLGSCLKTGDLDSSLKSLVQVFNEELFGKVSEEKEVEGIIAKLKEARAVKSYDSYELIARHAGKQSLMTVVTPVKKIIEESQSRKVSCKVEKVLKKICYGLLSNKDLDEKSLMLFTFAVIKDVPTEAPEIHQIGDTGGSIVTGHRPPSCLILEREPRRGGEKPKVDRKTNVHLLTEFALNILYQLLKKRLSATDPNHAGLCDPFLVILSQALISKHIKTLSISLQCLRFLLKYPLPSLPSHIKRITNRLFILLHKYASAGAAKGDNAELVVRCFQVVTVLVREVTCYKINEDKLRVLLTFCESDLYDLNRQSTAFGLLKAILKRNFKVTEIDDLMKKIEELSVTSDASHVQVQCRQLILKYLSDYPLGKKMTYHFEFFVSQLSFAQQTGRISALELLATIFSQLPKEVLIQHAGLFFVPLSKVLADDDSADCKKLAALSIKALLSKLDEKTYSELYLLTTSWAKDEKIVVKTLAMDLWGLFVKVNKSEFSSYLDVVLPLICDEIKKTLSCEMKEDTDVNVSDKYLFSLMSCLLAILGQCEVFSNPERHLTLLNDTLVLVHSAVNHSHIWVSFTTCQIFGLLFSTLDISEIATCMTGNSDKYQGFRYLHDDARIKFLRLTRDFCNLLQSPLMEEQFSDQIIKNLLFILRVAKKVHDISDVPPVELNPLTGKPDPQFSLFWLVKKVVNVANLEVKSKSKRTLARTSVFKWIAAATLELGADLIGSFLPNILPCLQREINEKSTTLDKDLQALSHEVLDMLRGAVGGPTFAKQFALVETYRKSRREETKRKRSEQCIADPALAAKQKIRKLQLKRVSRKRKADERKRVFKSTPSVKKRRKH